MTTTATSHMLMPIATCMPPSPARSWQTSAHPYLPLLATASSDKTVRIYSLTSFTLLSTITGGHKRSVRCCAWKPGMKGERESVLATGSFDATAGIWRGDNSRQKIGGDAGNSPGEALSTANGADDGSERDEDDEEDYRFAIVLEGHDSEIKAISWSVHGSFLATCSRDKSVWIWEALEADGDDDNLETVAVLQEHDGDVKCVAWHPSEESCLASSSYDEMARVWREDADGEWGCVAVCEGHDGTVWCVEWEPEISLRRFEHDEEATSNGVKPADTDSRAKSGPRLLTASADLTLRIWRRKPKAPPPLSQGPRLPSIIRSTSDEEEWHEETQLPQRHERAIYSASWSKNSGRVASAGSDGRIVVYEEREASGNDGPKTNGDVSMDEPEDGAEEDTPAHPVAQERVPNTHWVVVAELEAAHGVFEINHVCWARRYGKGRNNPDEEVIVSTGDDGEVKVWTIDSAQ